MLNDRSVVLAPAMMRTVPFGPQRNVCPSPDRTTMAAAVAAMFERFMMLLYVRDRFGPLMRILKRLAFPTNRVNDVFCGSLFGRICSRLGQLSCLRSTRDG